MGAVLAYIVIPWRSVLKWLAVAVCVGMAYSMFTSAGTEPIYRWLGGIFFGFLAVAAARSEYREPDPASSRKKAGRPSPEPYRPPCFACDGLGKVRCVHWLANDKDSRGYSCYECQGTHFKRCVVCKGSGKQ